MRAVLVVVAWCVVAAGVPAGAPRIGDAGDPTAQPAPDDGAKLVPRRHAAAPRFGERDRTVALPASPVAVLAPARRPLSGERVTGARPVVPLVLARSSRGPPIG